MSDRSVSLYTDTSALHEILSTLIQNGYEFSKFLIKRPQTIDKQSSFQIEITFESLCKLR